MTGTLQVFESAEFELRVTPVDDSFHVEAPGLAKALGFRQALDMVRALPDTEKGYELVRTPGADQHRWYVTEPGFYRVIGQRQAARITDDAVRTQVIRFQDWVYRDVLPSIRKTGGYVTKLSPRELAQLVIAESDRADAAEARAVESETRVAELEPAAAAWGVLSEAKGDYSVREAAHILNRTPGIDTGQKRLFDYLREIHLIDKRNVPYARFSKFVVERAGSFTHPVNGETATSQVRITIAGLDYLRKRLASPGTGAA